MSILSANTLFHFTKLEYLKNILEFGFWPRYSEEILFDGILGEEGFRMYVPMVCFCDIPLTRIEKHQKVYDSYGIGLTKDWGIKNHLNPVFYVHHQAPSVTGALMVAMSTFIIENFTDKKFSLTSTNKFDKNNLSSFFKGLTIKEIPQEAQSSPYPDLFYNFLSLFFLPYIKAYKGQIFRGIQNYSYYDEKEWRFIPDMSSESATKFAFESDVERNQANELLKKQMLTFEPNDIKYLILQNDNEIEPLRVALKSIDERTGKYPTEVIDILTARITTCKQIREDF